MDSLDQPLSIRIRILVRKQAQSLLQSDKRYRLQSPFTHFIAKVCGNFAFIISYLANSGDEILGDGVDGSDVPLHRLGLHQDWIDFCSHVLPLLTLANFLMVFKFLN